MVPSVYCGDGGVFKGDTVRGCGDACNTCIPSNGGNNPSGGVLADIDGDSCDFYEGAVPYDADGDAGTRCSWFWFRSGVQVTLTYVKEGYTTFPGGACELAVGDGEWFISVAIESTTVWNEITTGFACDPGTGKVSGVHTFGTPCGSSSCSGTPTFTVAA